MEKNLISKGGRNGVPPAQKCSWFKDVVQDGDVHPHPGPSGRSQQMQFMSINVGGASNCWAAARWATKHRPPVVVVQEVCMNTAKQADLADFMLRNGYRSWFACPPTHGGVGIFVICTPPQNSHPCRRSSGHAPARPRHPHRCLFSA